MHKYLTIVMDIRHKISSGIYAQGDKLPTIPELCEQYDVSKITVKRAMDELESLGLVARRRGSGTYVKGIAGTNTLTGVHDTLDRFESHSFDREDLGARITREVHDFLAVQPPTDIAELLDMDADSFAYYICSTRFVNGIADLVEHTYVPLHVAPNLTKTIMEDSLYRYLEDKLGLKVASAHRAIGAVHPNKDEAAWLDVKPQTPLLSVRQVSYLDDGTPFEVSTCVHGPGYEIFSVNTR